MTTIKNALLIFTFGCFVISCANLQPAEISDLNLISKGQPEFVEQRTPDLLKYTLIEDVEYQLETYRLGEVADKTNAELINLANQKHADLVNIVSIQKDKLESYFFIFKKVGFRVKIKAALYKKN